jgi:hypothetical protein
MRDDSPVFAGRTVRGAASSVTRSVRIEYRYPTERCELWSQLNSVIARGTMWQNMARFGVFFKHQYTSVLRLVQELKIRASSFEILGIGTPACSGWVSIIIRHSSPLYDPENGQSSCIKHRAFFGFTGGWAGRTDPRLVVGAHSSRSAVRSDGRVRTATGRIGKTGPPTSVHRCRSQCSWPVTRPTVIENR